MLAYKLSGLQMIVDDEDENDSVWRLQRLMMMTTTMMMMSYLAY